MSRVLKCVVVGDGAVGKTSLLTRFTTNTISTNYVPTIFENYSMDMQVDGISYTLNLFDTTGQKSYSNIRPFVYPDTDVFLVCFSVDHPISYGNVKSLWVPEITHFRKETPFLIVGTKTDQRNKPEIVERLAESKEHLITPEQGIKLAKKVNAVKYVECSAVKYDGISDLFNEAILAVKLKPEVTKRNCSLM